MTPVNPRARGVDDELVNLALVALLAVFGVSLLLRGAGSIAAFLTGTEQPSSGMSSGFQVLLNARDPGAALEAKELSAAAYWLVVAAGLTVLAGTTWVTWRMVSDVRHRAAHNPHRLPGTATARDIEATASKKALLRRGQTYLEKVQIPGLYY